MIDSALQRFVFSFLVVVLVAFGLKSCFSPRPPTSLEGKDLPLALVPWSPLEKQLLGSKGITEWGQALAGSARYYAKRNPTAEYTFGKEIVTAKALAKATLALSEVAKSGDSQKVFDHLGRHFRLFKSPGREKQKDVLVTAYYEPLLHGARTPSETNHYPLYRRPKDLLEVKLSDWSNDYGAKRLMGRLEGKRLKPYFDRQEIDQGGKLKDQALELVWVDDPVEAFFLHIQGSGRVKLTDGETMRVGYDGANGRPYRSIGKLLIDEGEIPRKEMSLQALEKWLAEHPKEQDRVLNYNPSYVFFRELDGPAVGNIGVPLTPNHSIATDYRLFPKGAPAILVTELPRFSEDGQKVLRWERVTRLVVNQDTGGAIRGAGRVDLFMGFGEEAERAAGIMKQARSELYFLAPRKIPAIH
ncbi:MAG: murein transglycosylase A [Magnetococcales bacterium]|nr:murein transglycosylase A [Magnetococcales bacterium]